MWWYYKNGDKTDLFAVEEFKLMRNSVSTVSDVYKWDEEGRKIKKAIVEEESRYKDWREALDEK